MQTQESVTMKKGPSIEGSHSVPLLPLRKPPIDIESLAKVPLGNFSQLPDQPGTYLAVDNANRVWYIGIATSLRDRLQNHDRLEDFRRKSVTQIAWQQLEAMQCRAREEELIAFFHPPLNDQHNFHALPECDLGLTPDQEVTRFLRLRMQLKLIEMELESLKPNVVTQCQNSGGTLQHPLGSIRIQPYKTWMYSEQIELLKLRLKNAKKEEEQNGSATVKSEKLTPVARLNQEALSQEVRLYLARFKDDEGPDEMLEAV